MLLTLTASESLFDMGHDDFAKTAERLICLFDSINIGVISLIREKDCVKIESTLGLLELYPQDKAGYYLLTGLERMIEQNPGRVDTDVLEYDLPQMSVIDDYFCDIDWYQNEVLTEVD